MEQRAQFAPNAAMFGYMPKAYECKFMQSFQRQNVMIVAQQPQNCCNDEPLSKTPSHKIPLPMDYIPSPHTVVIGRGKFCFNASGSRRLRTIALTFLPKYSIAASKMAKSNIVSDIIDIVESSCRSGAAFVKFYQGRWWEVDTSTAREKVGYVLRDLLADKYRSTSKSKAAAKRKSSAKCSTDGLKKISKSDVPSSDSKKHDKVETEPVLSTAASCFTDIKDRRPSSTSKYEESHLSVVQLETSTNRCSTAFTGCLPTPQVDAFAPLPMHSDCFASL